MNSTQRPNQDGLYQALNIYRDTMRPFILEKLETVPNLDPDHRFQNPADIDIGDFPYLFRRYWQSAFEQYFDPHRDIRGAIGIITEARNRVSHPDVEDLDSEYTRARLHAIADILGQINAPEQQRAVEAIRDNLFTQRQPSRRRYRSLVVTMPDGERIQRETNASTFVAVIEKLGVERVAACNIERFYTPIVATSRHPRHRQVQSGAYFILTAQSTSDQARDLLYIASALGIELNVEILMPEDTL